MHFRKNFESQAKFCKNIVQNIRGLKEFENLHVGVLVGKKRQKDIIAEELKSCRYEFNAQLSFAKILLGISSIPICCMFFYYCSPDTLVDKYAAYCGLEKDVIVACMPVLLFPEKFLYTAMTRAKRSVIICGDFSRYKVRLKCILFRFSRLYQFTRVHITENYFSIGPRDDRPVGD